MLVVACTAQHDMDSCCAPQNLATQRNSPLCITHMHTSMLVNTSMRVGRLPSSLLMLIISKLVCHFQAST
jgi:hypothetical protein